MGNSKKSETEKKDFLYYRRKFTDENYEHSFSGTMRFVKSGFPDVTSGIEFKPCISKESLPSREQLHLSLDMALNQIEYPK